MLRNFSLAVLVGFFLVATAFVVPISSANAAPMTAIADWQA